MKRIISIIVLFTVCVLVLCSCTKEGRDIRNVEINDKGELILNFTDGTQSNLGRVSGEDGKDGKDGVNGEKGDAGTNGIDGKNGINGVNGKDGLAGKDGRGIKTVVQGEDGNIVVTYIDGTTETVAMTFAMLGGKCGESVQWALYTGGLLVIDGEGSTYDYGTDAPTPWAAFASGITAVYFNGLSVVAGAGLLDGFDESMIIGPEDISPSVWVDMTVSAPIRSSASAENDTNVIGQAAFGSEWKCIEWGEDLSAVIYNGEIVYIETKYLNKDNGSLAFDSVEKQVKVVAAVNIRTYTDATDDSNVYHLAGVGDILNVTGVSKNQRWYRIEYDGETLYVRNSAAWVVDVSE